MEARVQLAFLYILAWETDGELARLEASEALWQEVLEKTPDDPFALVESAYIRYVLHGDGPLDSDAFIADLLEGCRAFYRGEPDSAERTWCRGERAGARALGRERTRASSYRYLVTEPNLRRLARERRFQELLQERYEQWSQILEQQGPGLPVQPAPVPSSPGFLRLPLSC